ncbi:hypothetical protein ACQPZJ_16085 [Actinoplanes sp. CA-054009]
MSNVLEQSEAGREIARRNWQEGFAQGFAESYARSLERCVVQGRVDGMRVLLRAKYGDVAGLEELARLLTERDHEGSIARIVAGAGLAELRS